MRHWRKMTWVILAWVALIIVWIAVGVNDVADDCNDEVGEARELCEAGRDIGAGIGVTIVVLIGVIGFIVLAIIWFMTRPPQPQIQYVVQSPTDDDRSRRQRSSPPPPPRQSRRPAGWYRDPSGQFDLRYFDDGWTDHVVNEGDDTVYNSPVPRG